MGLNERKCDAGLGRDIHKYLVEKGVETPVLEVSAADFVHDDIKLEIIEASFAQILATMGLDLNDDSLTDTPRRMAKMYVDELFWGLNPNHFPKCTVIENKMRYDEMVLERDITVMSTCEHHFVTIHGVAHVAYIPDKWVLGLSKMNRVVEYFARRPQVQERLTEQVYYAMQHILRTDNIAVVIDAEHYCVKSRGVEDANSTTLTSKLGGLFKTEPELRAEFMNLLRK